MVPVLPLSRISRDEEMFSASRNSVSSSSVVGNEVNSTGRTRYSETISTVTDIRMSVTISRSSTKPGSGVIRATTMPSTASGTAISAERRSSGSACHPAGQRAGAGMALAGVMALTPAASRS